MAFERQFFEFCARRELESHSNADPVNSLSRVEIESSADDINIEKLLFIGAHQERLGRSAGDMERDKLAVKKFNMPARIDSRRDMTRLMREFIKRHAQGR